MIDREDKTPKMKKRRGLLEEGAAASGALLGGGYRMQNRDGMEVAGPMPASSPTPKGKPFFRKFYNLG